MEFDFSSSNHRDRFAAIMISITKVFRFEAAHAIHGYVGPCAHIHGHSYELHVRVRSRQPIEGYLKGQGILIDFKELKMLVNENVVRVFDHKLVLSKEYLSNTKNVFSPEALFVFDAEPTAENMLIYIRNTLLPIMPSHIKLSSLQLWETRDSYAEWYAI